MINARQRSTLGIGIGIEKQMSLNIGYPWVPVEGAGSVERKGRFGLPGRSLGEDRCRALLKIDSDSHTDMIWNDERGGEHLPFSKKEKGQAECLTFPV